MKQATRCGTSSTMVDHRRNVLEKPLVGTVTEVEDVSLCIWADDVATKFTPAFGDDGSYAGLSNSLHDGLSQESRIVENDASETDVNRSGTVFEPSGKIRWWRIIRRLPKEKPADICVDVS